MSKRNVNVRYPPDTIQKVRFVAERLGVDQAEVWRKLANTATTIDRIHSKWQRIEREVSKLGSKPERKLVERHDALMDRLGELSEAEQHLLDQIQAELRVRADADEAEADEAEADEAEPALA